MASCEVLDANLKRERHADEILAICSRPIEVFVTAAPDEIVRRLRPLLGR